MLLLKRKSFNMRYNLRVSKYYSENRGLVKLRYLTNLVIDTEKGAWIEYKSANGRKCKMKFYENQNGYLWTSLALEDHTKLSGRLNRLIYSNVYGEIPKGYEVDHIDRNRKNNMPENLRLVTKLENAQNREQMRGERNGFSKLTEKEVRDILVLVLEHKKTKQEIADMYNVSFATIKAIRNGRNWKHFTKDIFEKYGINKEV